MKKHNYTLLIVDHPSQPAIYEISTRLISSAILIFILMFASNVSFGQATVQTFNASGTFTVPAGVTNITVGCWGGGGGGGGSQNTFLTARFGGGGGGGGYSQANFSVAPGQILTIVRGAGGTGVSNANGNPGVASSVTNNTTAQSISAGGGSGGVKSTAATGGAGGIGSTFNGGAGGTGTGNGAGGGGAAGNNGNGNPGSNTAGGAGGSGNPAVAPYIGGNGAPSQNSATNNGNAGISPGGGGGGGKSNTATSAGGAGAGGQIVISYFKPAISGFSPLNGCGGSTITINGSNFAGALASDVTIGGTPVSSIISNTGNQIVAVIATGTTGQVSVTSGGNTGTSIGIFTVDEPANISVQPGIQSICEFQNAAFSVGATGAGITYQWQEQVGGIGAFINISNGGIYSGANSSSLLLTNPALAMSSNNYCCVVTGSCGSPVTSSPAALNIAPTPVISAAPLTQTLCAENPITDIIFSDINGSSNGGSSLSWSRSTPSGITGIAASGTSSPIGGTFSSSNSTPTIVTFTITGTLAGCVSAPINADVTVNPGVAIITQPSSQVICETYDAAFSIGVAGGGILYQWQEQVGGVGAFNDLSDGGIYSGVNTPVLNLTNPAVAASGNNYQCVVNSSCGALTSLPALLSINPTPALGISPLAQTLCSGSAISTITIVDNNVMTAGSSISWTAFYEANVSGSMGGSGTSDIAGTVTNVNPSINGDAIFSIVATYLGCTSHTQTAVVTVSPNVIITSEPQSETRCSNTSSATFTVTATGLPALSFQWQEQVGGAGPYNDISNGGVYGGVTTNTLTLTNPPIGHSGNHYRCVINGTCGPVESNGNSVLIINPQPVLSVTPSSGVNCSGTGATLVASSSVAGTAFTWSPTTALNPPAGNSQTEVASPSLATTYTVTGSASGCSGNTTVTVSIGTTPNAVTVSPVTSDICPGNIKQLTAGGGQTGTSLPLDGAQAGGFENATSTFSANGWTQVGTTAPTWFVGTAGGSQNGSKSAFYGSGASTYGTTSSTVAVNHFFRDVFIPAGATNVFLNYYYKMPLVDNTFDFFYVHTGSSALPVPVAGTVPASYTQQFVNTATAYAAFTAMPTVNLTAFAGSTVRIIFSFKTDAASPFANPAVDNVSITATLPPAEFIWSPITGLFTDPGASIPYAGTALQVVYASPSATTNYSVTSTNLQGCSSATNAIVNFTTLPPAINSYSTGCSNQSITLNGSSLINVTAATIDGISVSPTIISDNQLTMIVPSGVSGSNIPVTLTSSCGTSTDNSLTVNQTPEVAVSPAAQTKCTGADISQLVLTNPNNIPATTISWSRTAPSGIGGSVPLSGSGVGPLTIDGTMTSTNAVSTPVLFTISATAAGCTTTTTATVTMSPALSGGLSPTASPTSVCQGSPTSLSATAGNQPSTIILSENFNGAPVGWTTGNTSVGGTPANAAWTLRADAYSIPFCLGLAGMVFHSNDNTQMYLTSSNLQAGTTTNTTLISPAFSTMGFSTASLSFFHYFNISGTATVEVSTNGGGSWTTVQTYNALQGSPSGVPGCLTFPNSSFVNAVVNLNAYINNPSVKVRFHYVTSGTQTWWAIDNVTISGAPIPSFSWSSIPAGFTSNLQNPGATTPTANPTSYFVTATNSGLGTCATSQINVSILPLPSVSATNNSPFCSGTQNLEFLSNAPTASFYAWTGPGGYNANSPNPFIPNAPNSASGSYQLKVTDSNGCKDSITTLVNIYDLPSVGIVVIGSNNLCSGQTTADLQATGADTYLWNTTDNTSLITVSTAGTYSVTGTDGNGCINSQTQVITESMPPAIPVITPSGTSTICADANGPVPVTLSCTNYTTDLLWSTSETTASIAVDYLDIFNVTYTDLNGCYSVSASIITEADAIAPSISCPADLITCSQTPSLGSPVTSDNCSVAFIGNDAPPVFTLGNTDVTWTVTDYSNNSTTCIQHVTVQSTSTDPSNATSNANYDQICLGGSATLSVSGGTLGTGATWQWYEGGCGSGAAIGTGASITITPATTGSHNYFVRAEGYCGNTACTGVSLNVISTPPSGTVHYTATFSDGCVGAPASALSVNALPGASFYRWTSSQAGVRFNGNPSPYETTVPNVNVTFISLPSAGSSGWSICVFGGNACGNSNTICTWIRATLSAPNAINGSVIGCPGTSGNNYAVPAIAGAVSYLWSATGGITISGNGASSVQLTFPAGFVSGILRVHGQTSCGYNGPDRAVTITAIPSIPGIITGPSYPCPNASAAYSVSPVSGAASYTWSTTVPGAIVSGNLNSCTILFPAVIPSGSIVSVVANSSCPTSSPVRSKGIASGVPNVPVSISGPPSGQCGQTGVSYSIAPVNLATSYSWNTTCGTLVGPTNLSGVTVDWPSNFVVCTLSVSASNACGVSIARILGVFGAPSLPPAIAGNISPCAGTMETYSTAGSSGANSYTWTVPAGCTIIGPANGASITLIWGSTSGNITTRASNDCGNSAIRSLACTISCRVNQMDASAKNFGAIVFPNPTAGKATLKLSSLESDKILLQIADVEGRILYSENVIVSEGISLHELDLGSYSKGLYLIQLKGDNLNEMLRISVE